MIPTLVALTILTLCPIVEANPPVPEPKPRPAPRPVQHVERAERENTESSAEQTGRVHSQKPATEGSSRTKARSKIQVVPSRPKTSSPRFRRPGLPGSGNYESPDFSEIPKWRQISFFGLRAEGRVFIFVIDRSGSMASNARLIRAKLQLIETIRKMQFPQRYLVITFNETARPLIDVVPVSANRQGSDLLRRQLRYVEPIGETNPLPAMRMAINLRPDAIFLLADGDFPEGAASTINAYNDDNRIPIHCVDLVGGVAGDDLKQIAKQSGGQYLSRP